MHMKVSTKIPKSKLPLFATYIIDMVTFYDTDDATINPAAFNEPITNARASACRAELIEQRLLDAGRVSARKKLKQTEREPSQVIESPSCNQYGFAVVSTPCELSPRHLSFSAMRRRFGSRVSASSS